MSFTTLIVTHLDCSIAEDLLEDWGGGEGEDGQHNRKTGCSQGVKMVYSVICINDWCEFGLYLLLMTLSLMLVILI